MLVVLYNTEMDIDGRRKPSKIFEDGFEETEMKDS